MTKKQYEEEIVKKDERIKELETAYQQLIQNASNEINGLKIHIANMTLKYEGPGQPQPQ